MRLCIGARLCIDTSLPDNFSYTPSILEQSRRPQIPFYQRTQPSWWRPKGMTSALVNSPKQALCKPMSASERGRKGIPRTSSMLVSVNTESPQRIDPFPDCLEARNLLRLSYRPPGPGHQPSRAHIGVLKPGPSCTREVLALTSICK